MRELGEEQEIKLSYKDIITINKWRLPLAEWKKAFSSEDLRERIKMGNVL